MAHVETKSKLDYNYVLLSENLSSEQEQHKFHIRLEQWDKVLKMEMFLFKTNPVRRILVNFFIRLKGLFLYSPV